MVVFSPSLLPFPFLVSSKNDMHTKTKKVLNSMQLRSTFTGVFAKATDGLFQKLLKVQPYVTYGYVTKIHFSIVQHSISLMIL